jgi:hypothetical protein
MSSHFLAVAKVHTGMRIGAGDMFVSRPHIPLGTAFDGLVVTKTFRQVAPTRTGTGHP